MDKNAGVEGVAEAQAQLDESSDSDDDDDASSSEGSATTDDDEVPMDDESPSATVDRDQDSISSRSTDADDGGSDEQRQLNLWSQVEVSLPNSSIEQAFSTKSPKAKKKARVGGGMSSLEQETKLFKEKLHRATICKYKATVNMLGDSVDIRVIRFQLINYCYLYIESICIIVCSGTLLLLISLKTYCKTVGLI
jgi:hypothetical protein